MEASTVVRIGLDLAKQVFQVHGVDASEAVVVRRRLRRAEVERFFGKLAPCVVAMEACATAHYWGRRLGALGHEVRLLPPADVKAYVRRGQKNDAADAAALCEAAGRSRMSLVPVKSVEQQAVMLQHRVRARLVRERTRLGNVLRGHLAEFGLIAATGPGQLRKLIALVDEAAPERLPALARVALRAIVSLLEGVTPAIEAVEAEIMARQREDQLGRRLQTIPGVGPLTAAAMSASIADPRRFSSGRHFAAWLGLTPRQNSSGGKERLGAITKMGDRYLRTLLVLGATALLRPARSKAAPSDPLLLWLRKLLARKPARLATLAFANKMARIVWVLMTRGGSYDPRRHAAA